MESNSDIKFDNEEQEKNAYRKNLIDVNLPKKLKEKEDIKINSFYRISKKKMEEEERKKFLAYLQKLRNDNKELTKKLEEKENTINKLNEEIIKLKKEIKDQQEVEHPKNEIKDLKEGFKKIDELLKLIREPNEYELILAPKKKIKNIIEQSQNEIIDAQEKLIEKLQGNEGGNENDEEIERLKEIIEEKNKELKNAQMIIAVYGHNYFCGVKDFFQKEGKQSMANNVDNIIRQNNNYKKDDDEENDFDVNSNMRREIEPTNNSTLKEKAIK